MTTEEIRREWCKIKGFNYIDFDTLKEAEEYVLFLESKLEALNIADVVGQSEQFMCYEYDLNGKSKPCKEQCKKCREYQLRADSA